MKRIAVAFALLAATTLPAGAWEADTTHAGLTEQAALASTLHDVLTQRFGRELGVYDPLAVGKQSAGALYRQLGLLAPSSGLVPDARGRQSALAWLVAGAVIEDMPAGRGENHFYDPARKRGLSRGASSLAMMVFRASSGDGRPAPEWILAENNELSLKKFWSELEQAATAATAAEREQHLALALVTAGALAHVLEDVGSPSRARNDWSEHTQRLGGGAADRGSRFERLAGLVHGRLGVPAPDGVERRARLRDFFTSADGKGLADWTNRTWWSSGTLPAEKAAPEGVPDGERRISADGGACKAVARVERGRQRYTIPDACAAEQLAAILPRVGAYARGLIEWLFRGGLGVSVDAGVVTVEASVALGPGAVRVLVDDDQGNRRELAAARVGKPTSAGATLAKFELGNASGARVTAVFRGTDDAGEEIVAVGKN